MIALYLVLQIKALFTRHKLTRVEPGLVVFTRQTNSVYMTKTNPG